MSENVGILGRYLEVLLESRSPGQVLMLQTLLASESSSFPYMKESKIFFRIGYINP